VGKIINITLCKAGTIGIDVFVISVRVAWNYCQHECGKREGAFKEGEFVRESFYLQSGFQQKIMYCKYFLGSPR